MHKEYFSIFNTRQKKQVGLKIVGIVLCVLRGVKHGVEHFSTALLSVL